MTAKLHEALTTTLHDQPALRPEVERERLAFKEAWFHSELGRKAMGKFTVRAAYQQFSEPEIAIVLAARDARKAQLSAPETIPDEIPESLSQPVATVEEPWTPYKILEELPPASERQLDWRERQFKD
jgi:hypothetical protein